MEKVQAVFFDATETLIHLPNGVAAAYCRVASAHGLALQESAVNHAFRAVWKAMPPRSAQQDAREDDDRGWWKTLVARVVEECGGSMREQTFANFFDELYAHFAQPGVWALYPDVMPALDALRGRYALGIISNFDRRLLAVLGHLEIAHYFTAIIVSSETGADKPHPQIFRRALAKLGVRADEAVHVGDDPVSDWQGAEDAGLRCFRLDRRKNSLRDLPSFLDAMVPRGS